MSISAQGVVERASAELSKRITGLGLRGNKQHRDNNNPPQSPAPRAAKTSVMERVTNVFCGPHAHAHALTGAVHPGQAPEKPSRLPSLCKAKVSGGAALPPADATPGRRRRPLLPPRPALPAPIQAATWEQLLLDERFAPRLLEYFTAGEKRVLAQVCPRWRDLLYRSPRHWTGLLPVLRCAELRRCPQAERDRLYVSLVRRGFHAVSLLGATDEDALDLVNSFPAASKHVHSLSLRCSSVSDRGLETLLDHLQVSSHPRPAPAPLPVRAHPRLVFSLLPWPGYLHTPGRPATEKRSSLKARPFVVPAG